MDANESDNDKAEFDWQMDQRMVVADYLKKQGVQHGKISRWPAWHVFPYLAVFPIESLASPGRIGWWAICGDCPADYMSSKDAGHPRDAMRYFAKQWEEIASYMLRGEPHPTTRIGSPENWPVLGDLLLRRSQLLREFADDEAYWNESDG